METPKPSRGMAGRTLACSAVLAFITVPALAQESSKVEWSATGTITSDYIFRGISLTNEDPAAQGSIDLTYGTFYAGAWASNVSDVGYEPLELDLYAGIKPEWRSAEFDFGFVWYTYPGKAPGALGLQYVELKAGLEFSPIANLKFSPVFWFVPDQKHAPTTYTIESGVSRDLRAVGIFKPSIGGLIGYTTADEEDAFAPGVEHYAYWNAGLTLTVENLEFDFRYWDTSIDGNRLANEYFDETDTTIFGLADARFVFTTTLSLP